MKKLKKINLELNKEVVSTLSNDNLNHFIGGNNPTPNPFTEKNCPVISIAEVNCTKTNIQSACQPTYDLTCGLVPATDKCGSLVNCVTANLTECR